MPKELYLISKHLMKSLNDNQVVPDNVFTVGKSETTKYTKI